MNEQLKPILAELKARLVDLYGERLSRVILYGSQARGDAEPDSDIDVLVVLKGTVEFGTELRWVGPIVADISLRNTVVLSPMILSETDMDSRRNQAFLQNIRHDGIKL
ncbi:nucleotidyltransferase domain-containing protein [candidate division KSB1 bacterium]|nr:nucleotidyltransferase domain-containing protein [candidate division KSB1 bacterium]